MTWRNRRWPAPFIVLLCLWLFPLIAQAEPIAIVVNGKNPVTALSRAKVASMFRGEELRWAHGGRIKLVNREISSLVRKDFYRDVLNAKPDQKFYRPGTPVAVQSLIQRSDEAVLRFVAAIEGAIGYVRLSKLNNSVQVVLIVQQAAER